MPFFSMFMAGVASFTLTVLFIATFGYLPQGAVSRFPVRFSYRFTSWLREPKVRFKVLYWGIPISVFLFSSILTGTLLLMCAYLGVLFNKRWNAAAFSD